MPKEKPPPCGGGPGDGWLAGEPSCQSQTTAVSAHPSSLDLAREQQVLHGLARLLAALLPQRSAITQGALDALAAAYNDLSGVRDILQSEPVRGALEGEP